MPNLTAQSANRHIDISRLHTWKDHPPPDQREQYVIVVIIPSEKLSNDSMGKWGKSGQNLTLAKRLSCSIIIYACAQLRGKHSFNITYGHEQWQI